MTRSHRDSIANVLHTTKVGVREEIRLPETWRYHLERERYHDLAWLTFQWAPSKSGPVPFSPWATFTDELAMRQRAIPFNSSAQNSGQVSVPAALDRSSNKSPEPSGDN